MPRGVYARNKTEKSEEYREEPGVSVAQTIEVIAPQPRFITFGEPDISQKEIDAVVAVLKSGWVGTGKVSRQFEQEFASHMGGGYAVAVNSCTMGLILAMRVCNLGQGKEVLTSPLTFAATVNAILQVGAKPVFVDVDDRGCLDPDLIANKVTDKTGGVIPVHYSGAAVNMGRLAQAAESFGLKVIEDAAHGFGGEYFPKTGLDRPVMPRKLGTMGDFGVFSFYATKNITSGEGGMIVTKYGDLAERIRILSNQGQTASAWDKYGTGPVHPYEVIHDGYKGNMPDVLSAIGLAQLRRWPELREKRAIVWKHYEDNLGLKDQGHSQHFYTIRVRNRDIFRQKMWEMGIGTGVHYTPLHLEPGYKNLGFKKGDFPMAEKIGSEVVSLPVSSKMNIDDADRVVRAVKMLREATQ